ncbi:MAG: hypothetical protein ACKVX7_04840 [Planctomycetota bacterium]
MDPEEQQLDEFLNRIVDQLRRARGNSAEIRAVIGAYLEEGDSLEMSPLELQDYFDISSPGLAEQAGYGQAGQAEASLFFGQVSEQRYGG